MIRPDEKVRFTHDNFLWFLDNIKLPKDLIWQDEFLWEPVAQVYEYSVEGNLLIQESTKKKGRHITLVGQNDMAWLDRTDMKALIDLRNRVGKKMVLKSRPVDTHGNLITFPTQADEDTFAQTHDGWITVDVMFRHQDTAIEYSLIKPWDQFEIDTYFIIQAIRLMEVLPPTP